MEIYWRCLIRHLSHDADNGRSNNGNTKCGKGSGAHTKGGLEHLRKKEQRVDDTYHKSPIFIIHVQKQNTIVYGGQRQITQTLSTLIVLNNHNSMNTRVYINNNHNNSIIAIDLEVLTRCSWCSTWPGFISRGIFCLIATLRAEKALFRVVAACL